MLVGLDVHKNYIQAAVMNEEGRLLKEDKFQNDLQSVEKFFTAIKDAKVVMESSSTWYHLYRFLSKRYHVILSNPVKTKAIASAKIKTDRIDARVLADLLRGGYIAECYIPDGSIMELRELVRYRADLVRARTRIKNRIHSILLMHGIMIDAEPFTRDFVRELKELKDYRIDGYLDVLESLNMKIRDASARIRSVASDDEVCRLLMSIPGIGYYSALLIVSEIGDISRFPDSYHLCSYAGLIPSTHSSGGVTYHGRITKRGSKYLRWIMTECTHTHVRTVPESSVSKFYAKIARKKGKQKGIVAAASKLLKIVYWVMKERREYHG
jgi:transposase